MRKFIVTMFLFLYLASSYAQTELDTTITDITYNDKSKLKREDFFISEIFSDIWQNTPSQPASLNTQTINRGYNAYIMLDNPIGNTNFSFAFGIGISTHNLYSNCIPFEVLDSSNKPTGVTEFLAIQDVYKYKKNKLCLFYSDIPVEIRFRTKNAGDNFKIAVGFKAGYLVQSHTKYEGDRFDNIEGTIKYKEYRIANIEKIRYGITGRIGYGRYNLTGFYSLTPLFSKEKGPDMFPISIGLAVTPF